MFFDSWVKHGNNVSYGTDKLARTGNTCGPVEAKSALVEALDLAKRNYHVCSEEQKVGLIIHSLKENYTSYGLKVIAKNCELEKVGCSNHSNFFIVPRVPLPAIKLDSNYIVWQQFVNKTIQFLDGENREEFISELCQLQNILSRSTDKAASTESLVKIFSDFENKSGFSSVASILPNDGDKGLLSPSEFKKLIASGHPIDDFGASLHHGRLSHRLQFYILGNYFLKNVNQFFTPQSLNALMDTLTAEYPEMLDNHARFPIHKIISVFYRLLGTDKFNECFDWKEFSKNRAKLNMQFNTKIISDNFNMADIWVQMFDRYGYGGFFSVPSTVGLLQKLGCFSSLPAISVPNISAKKDLRIIMDVTPKFNSY